MTAPDTIPAPADMSAAEVLREAERLKAKAQEWRWLAHENAKAADEAGKRATTAEARVRVLEEALRFYGDDVNYSTRGPLNPGNPWFTGPNRARAALSQHQKGEGGADA